MVQCSVMAAPVADVIILSDSSDLECALVEDEEDLVICRQVIVV